MTGGCQKGFLWPTNRAAATEAARPSGLGPLARSASRAGRPPGLGAALPWPPSVWLRQSCLREEGRSSAVGVQTSRQPNPIEMLFHPYSCHGAVVWTIPDARIGRPKGGGCSAQCVGFRGFGDRSLNCPLGKRERIPAKLLARSAGSPTLEGAWPSAR